MLGDRDSGKSSLLGLLLAHEENRGDKIDLSARSREKMLLHMKEIYKSHNYSQAELEMRLYSYAINNTELERKAEKTIHTRTKRFQLKSHTKCAFFFSDSSGDAKYRDGLIKSAFFAYNAVVLVTADLDKFTSCWQLPQLLKDQLVVSFVAGVRRFAILVNKMEEVNWSESNFDQIKTTITKYITTFSKVSAQNAVFIPISVATKEFIFSNSPNLAASWYKGPTFLEVLDQWISLKVTRAQELLDAKAKPVILSINRFFPSKTARSCVYVSANVVQGTVTKGAFVTLIGADVEKRFSHIPITFTIQGIQLASIDVEIAAPTQFIGLKLASTRPVKDIVQYVKSGLCLVADPMCTDNPKVAQSVDCQVKILPTCGLGRGWDNRSNATMFCADQKVQVRIDSFVHLLKNTGPKLGRNDTATITVVPQYGHLLVDPWATTKGRSPFGKVLFKDNNKTVAVGNIKSFVLSSASK
eukprot:TRINITY_DN8420_c0_g1_i2.p1 TRINITY_DN8420_c0_g1~~TRINITY_DN8420_c0_g1_i2.p1  ORF type:complete len:470 (-),score=59.87 TRINITY_DN8420_c0_g1_i2:4-1413(-)